MIRICGEMALSEYDDAMHLRSLISESWPRIIDRTDTLVIQVDDLRSEVGQILERCHHEFKEFVEMMKI